MNIGTRLKRGIAGGTAAAVTLGLASLAPTPRQTGTAEGCPTLDMGANIRLYDDPNTQRAANFGAWMLGFMAEKCQDPAADENFKIVETGDGQVHMTVTRTSTTEAQGATAGSYYLSVSANKDANGLNASDVTSFTVAETATFEGEGVSPTVLLTGINRGGRWRIYGDERTRPQAGGSVDILTGDQSTDADTSRVLGVAAMVALQEQADAATNFAPVS
jgi:hypothetical protein